MKNSSDFNNKSIAFLGCGHLGGSLVEGMLAQQYQAQKITVTRRNLDKLSSLKGKGVQVTDDNTAAVAASDVIVLCVRPDQLAILLDEIQPLLAESNKIVISVIAGLSIADIKHKIKSPIIRSMPNIASALGEGVTVVYFSDDADESTKHIANSVFSPSGLVITANSDEEVDSYTALCGSGPAYFFQFVLLMCKYGEARSLPAADVYKGVLQTMKGAAALLQASNKDPQSLINEIALPGEPTATGAALKVLATKEMEEIVMHACSKSEERAAAIGKEIGTEIRQGIRKNL